MIYKAQVRNEVIHFSTLREVMAKANEEKSGDQLAGIAAVSSKERIAARYVLADLPLRRFLEEPLIDADIDEVSRLINAQFSASAFAPFGSFTVGELRNHLLANSTDGLVTGAIRRALTPEMVAAVTKLMSNKDLVLAAASIRNVTKCRNTMGEEGVLGVRLQPNHPCDDIKGILLSTLDGLLLGCGDAMIGVNPAAESVASVSLVLRSLDQVIRRFGIPTQACCLSHITTQLACLDAGAPIDLLFQSIAGTEMANRSFGIDLNLLRHGQEKVLASHRARPGEFIGDDVMYFETGQGSALSAEAHHGVDQLTIEARAYGVARSFKTFLVNSVVGFIGPEYLANERQIIRAGLEDHFMGKIMGLPMGIDVCYTNHADADQNSADNLMLLLTAAGCNFFMGVPCSDDIMLNYQTTSFHDVASARQLFRRTPAPEFDRWLKTHGLAGKNLAAANLAPPQAFIEAFDSLIQTGSDESQLAAAREPSI